MKIDVDEIMRSVDIVPPVPPCPTPKWDRKTIEKQGVPPVPPVPPKKTKVSSRRRIFHYRLDGRQLVIIAAPGDGLPEIKRSLALRFGADRVSDIRPHEFEGDNHG